MGPDEEEVRRPRVLRVTPVPVETLGVEELHRYIADLRAEIERAEAEIARKHQRRSAAEAFFKKD